MACMAMSEAWAALRVLTALRELGVRGREEELWDASKGLCDQGGEEKRQVHRVRKERSRVKQSSGRGAPVGCVYRVSAMASNWSRPACEPKSVDALALNFSWALMNVIVEWRRGSNFQSSSK